MKATDYFITNNEVDEGERMADGTSRFNAHPSKNPVHSFLEPIDNMLTYGRDKGSIKIERNGINCNYIFINNADSEKLLSYEDFKKVMNTAGSSNSTEKLGSSICGMGLEVFGLESRPNKNAIVICEITIVRDGLMYGGKWYFNGIENCVYFRLYKTKATKESNMFKISYNNCATITKKNLSFLKAKISDKLCHLDHDFELSFDYYGEKEIITPADLLYRDELSGTDNYIKKEFVFEYESGKQEELTIEISNAYDIIKGAKGNYIDTSFGTKAAVPLSGVALIYDQYETLSRGESSWDSLGIREHDTLNHVRCDAKIGEYLFKQYHSESQVKAETTVSIKDVVDKYGQPIIFVDKETGARYTGKELGDMLNKLVYKYRTDKTSEKEKVELINTISSYSENNDVLIKIKDLLAPFKESKLKIKTLVEIIDKQIKEPCLINVN